MQDLQVENAGRRIEDVIREYKHVCWYPSSGVDFRPMLYLSDMFYRYFAGKTIDVFEMQKAERIMMPVYPKGSDHIVPDLFVMTESDPSTKVWNNNIWGGFDAATCENGTDILMLWENEWQKARTLFCDLRRTKIMIVGQPEKCVNSRAFFMRVQVTSRWFGEEHIWNTNLLYVVSGNLSFAREHLLGKNLQIETVINIRVPRHRYYCMKVQELFPALHTRYYIADSSYIEDYIKDPDEETIAEKMYCVPGRFWSGGPRSGEVISGEYVTGQFDVVWYKLKKYFPLSETYGNDRGQDKSLAQLKNICEQRAHELYNEDIFERYKPRLDYELRRIADIPDGAKTILKTREFVTTIRDLWYRGEYFGRAGGKPRFTFRGPASAGFVAYLCEITQLDPTEWEFYSWAFFQKAEIIEFNLNVTQRMYGLITNNAVKVPDCVILRVDPDQTVLEEAEWLGENCNCRQEIKNLPQVLNAINEEIAFFFRETVGKDDFSALQYMNDFDQEFVSDLISVLSYLREIGRLPASLEELCKLNGFLHAELRGCTRLDMLQAMQKEDVYGDMVSYSEDVYEKLIRKCCTERNARRIARTVQSAQKVLMCDDEWLLNRFCGREFAGMIASMKHLFYRSQCFENSIGTVELMRWYRLYPQQLKMAYEAVRKQ